MGSINYLVNKNKKLYNNNKLSAASLEIIKILN